MINLALRLGIPPREIDQWSIEDIRDCLAMLIEQAKPTSSKVVSDAELEARFNAMCTQ